MYKIDQDTPFRFAIWDYDHSFGRDGDNELNIMKNELDCNRSILFKRLSQVSQTGYLNQLKDRWFDLRKKHIISTKYFEKYMTKNDKIIRDELEKNFKLWPVDEKWYFDDNDYYQELDIMREFVKIRIKQLDNYFEQI